MKSELKVKFLQFLLNKKKDVNEGFTLIELLVVVIIIGVLAAVALPNMLGQVGKARESEAKTTIGALNRAQQAFYTEKARFVGNTTDDNINLLEVPVNTNPASTQNYYYYSVPVTVSATGGGKQLANGINRPSNGTKDYAGGVAYNSTDRTFSTVVCRNLNKDANIEAAGIDVAGVVTTGGAGCKTTTTEQIK